MLSAPCFGLCFKFCFVQFTSCLDSRKFLSWFSYTLQVLWTWFCTSACQQSLLGSTTAAAVCSAACVVCHHLLELLQQHAEHLMYSLHSKLTVPATMSLLTMLAVTIYQTHYIHTQSPQSVDHKMTDPLLCLAGLTVACML